MKLLTEADVKNKRVILRAAYDVPIVQKGVRWVIGDDTRIQSSLRTIKFLLRKKAKIIIVTYLGRPGGKFVEKLKLDPIAKRLGELLGKPVKKLDSCVGLPVRDSLNRMKPGDIIMLENVRFNSQEDRGDMNFGKTLASYGDLAVFEAFSQSHRDAPSTTGLLSNIPSYAGFDMNEEIEQLSSLLEKPRHPFVVVLGGAKISDKIATLKTLLPIADVILVGGAMCHNFLKTRGVKIARSLIEEQPIGTKKEKKKIFEVAEEIMNETKGIFFNLKPGLNVPKLLLPIDLVAARGTEKNTDTRVIDLESSDHLPWNWMYLDIGPKTVKLYTTIIAHAKMVFWNGPMGYVESPQFVSGTKAVASAIVAMKGKSVVGGGDTESAVRAFKMQKKFDYISTGGGAVLEFLSGKEFPVLHYLRK